MSGMGLPVLPITTDDGGIRGQHPALACMRLLPCSCWGLFRDRGRHYRKGFSQAADTTSTSHSRIIRNSSCDPAMCETRRRAEKRMGGRSWQKHGGSGGFWYCAEDNDHRCMLLVDDEAQVRSIDKISVWRCSRRDCLLREVVSRGTVPLSGTTIDRVVRERAHRRHFCFLVTKLVY